MFSARAFQPRKQNSHRADEWKRCEQSRIYSTHGVNVAVPAKLSPRVRIAA